MFLWSRFIFPEAAKIGNIEVMKWLKDNGCPFNKETFSWAAYNGNLENMKWLHSNGCPWDPWTFASAAKKGILKNMKWLHRNGCPWDRYTIMHAVEHAKTNKTLKNIKWFIHSNKRPDSNLS